MLKESTGNGFAKCLVSLRKANGLTQKQVSMLAGIPLPILRMMERGEILPNAGDPGISHLCDLFHVTPEQLLLRER